MPKSDAAAYTGLSVEKFQRSVEAGDLPRPIELRGRTLWDKAAIDRRVDQLAGGDDGAWIA